MTKKEYAKKLVREELGWIDEKEAIEILEELIEELKNNIKNYEQSNN